jgi:hypothetical protein
VKKKSGEADQENTKEEERRDCFSGQIREEEEERT